MAITSVALNNTFDEWRIRTNQVITSLNTINEANAFFSGSITITNPLGYSGNVSLNVSSGMIKGDGGLLTNLQSSIVAAAAYTVANAAFNAANAAPQTSRVNTIFSVANAAFDAANGAGSVTVSNTSPVTPDSGDLWWNTNYGRLFLYYNDGDTSQWVDTNPGASVGPVFDVANASFGVANAAFAAANAAPNSARVNTIFTVANAAFNAANNAVTDYSPAFNVANAGFTVANAAFNAANNAGGAITIGDETGSSSTFYVTLTGNTSGNVTSMNVSSSSLTFIPSTGTLSATVFNSLSDSSLKDNVLPINNALNVINNLSGVGFNWKESGQHSFGVLAQDMEKVIPDLVGNINNLKTVNYDGIIAFLIEAIKELNNKLENKE